MGRNEQPAQTMHHCGNLFHTPVEGRDKQIRGFPHDLVPGVHPDLVAESFRVVRDRRQIVIQIHLESGTCPVICKKCHAVRLFACRHLRTGKDHESPLLP